MGLLRYRMFNRAYFTPVDKNFSLDVSSMSRAGSAIERFVRENYLEVSVLRGGARISERQIEALQASNKFVIAIGDAFHLTNIREIECVEHAQTMTDGLLGSRHFDLLFLAIPEVKRSEFVALLDSLKDINHNVRAASDDPLATVPMLPFPESSVFRLTEDNSSVLVEFLKPQTEWSFEDLQQYEHELHSILQSLIPERDWERVENGSFFIDPERMAHCVQARADFINEFNLREVAHAVYIEVRDGTQPVLRYPATEGAHYPLFYKGLQVEPESR